MIHNLDLLKKSLIKIENIKTWLVDIPKLHPDAEKYSKLWSLYTKFSIEGLWGFDNGGWRYMPGTLFFYGNFFSILDIDQKQKVRRYIRPNVRDIDWMIHYAYLEAQGFSGWKGDDEFTSNYKVLNCTSPADAKGNTDLLTSKGELKKFIHPRENIKKLHTDNMGVPLYDNPSKNIMLFGSRGGGKALSINELVRVKDGWKEIQYLKIGDQVYDMYGKLSNVISKTEVQKDLNFYKLTLRDGREIEACEDHNWRVFDSYSRNYKVYNTKYLFDNLFINRNSIKNKSVESRFALPVSQQIEDSVKQLPLHPYVLGALLGDGGMTTNNIILTSVDQQIIDDVTRFLPDGYYLKHRSKNAYAIARKNNNIKPFSKYIKDLNLLGKKSEFKFIPKEYLFSSVENKMLLLKGLMDTDGYSDNRHIEFYTSSSQLSNDVLDLIRSLGISCKHTIKKTHYKKNGVKIDCLDCNRISVYTDKAVFSLDRKLEYLKHIKSEAGISKYDKSFITNIEYIGKKDGICIGVDNDTKTYITKNYIVTHNSFSFAGIAAHHITFDGLKYFTQEDYDNPPTVEVCVGSGGSEKSSEFCTKIEEGLKSFGTDNNLGVWGRADKGDEDYTPNPFYRDWEGSIGVGNKKNPFRYEYSAKINDRWIKGLGTKTKLIHVNYSDKKQGGEAAAAGGRYILHIYEEVGLMSNAVDTWFSNVGTITDSYGQQFGVQVAIGTSGVIELVQQSKKIFSNPVDYNCLEYEDIWENSGKIGFFLPSYMTNSAFKDENGNTDVEAALEFYMERRIEAAKSNDPENLRNEKMNFPIVPSDMWISSKGHHFPIMELAEREKTLVKKGLFRTIGQASKLIWDSTRENEIRIEPDLEAQPFFEFPYSSSMSKLDGAIMIYQEPEQIDGEIPKDMFFFVLDPYVADAIDEGGSLASLYGFVNPKYGAKYNGGSMVCSYTGKHPNGKDGYYENVEKILAYYGNCPRSLWYEANRGDSVRGYFVRKNKTNLLAIRPLREKGSSIYSKRALDFGIMVNGIDDKLQMIGDAAEYMMQHITYGGKEMRFVETIPDIFLVRQAMAFELKKHKNFDAVSAFIMAPFVIKELRHQTLNEIEKQTKHNPIAFLSMNPYQFKKEDTLRRLEKFKQKYEEQDQDY